MRPIDADAVIEILAVMQGRCSTKAELIHNSKIWQQVKHIPTIDAVPVIRCKDCKHYYALNEVRGNCSEYNFVEKIPIDYCSWAERKEE